MTPQFKLSQSMKLTVLLVFVTATVALLFAFAPAKVNQQKWTAPATADKLTNPIARTDASLATGKVLYTKTCFICHGKNGKGDGPKSEEIDKPVGDFTKATFGKQTDGAIYWKITEGQKPMPSFKKELTDEQRWTLVHYLREFNKTASPHK